jgi:hypothetical protein
MDRVDPLVERAAGRLRELEPEAIASRQRSYARGTADEHSDLVRAITTGEPRVRYRARPHLRTCLEAPQL